MSKRKMILSLGLGVAIGFFVKHQYDQMNRTSPEKVLKNAKDKFKKQGPISGSWIYMKPEEIEKNGLKYNAFRGGITRNIDGENKQYEFFADVETGAIIGTIQNE